MADCDRAYVVIKGVTLEFESFKVDMENNAKTINAMTRDGNPLGTAKGNRVWKLTGDLAMKKGTEDIDLDELEEENTVFTAGVEYEGGASYTYNHAEITNLGESAGHGEEAKRSVEITMWDRIKNAAA